MARRIDDDTPLITRPSPPRPPLSVRRATPEVPRLRSVGARGVCSISRWISIRRTPTPRASCRRNARSRRTGRSSDVDAPMPASLRRLAALAIDCLILAAIDVAVIYFTMQICGLGIAELRLLPKGPLVAFLLVQNVGYLVAFTAGGQTLGKMAAGIKVVPSDPTTSLDLGRALKRTVVWLVLACRRASVCSRRSSATIIAASTIASPARASSAPPRTGLAATERPLFALRCFATAFGVGYVPVAPGTVRLRRRPAALVRCCRRQPLRRRAAIAAVIVARFVERQRRRAPLRPAPIPGRW